MTPPGRAPGPTDSPGADPHRGQRRDGRGRSNEGPVRIGDALGAVASHLGAGRADVVGAVFGRWDDIVGPAVAAHVRPVRVDGVTLVVSADHPAWATQIRHLAPDILVRLTEVCGPQNSLERLDVRVRR
jgi:predicted nucleic acid-binding Zn ribbon protein